jgi:hypothetical protein
MNMDTAFFVAIVAVHLLAGLVGAYVAHRNLKNDWGFGLFGYRQALPSAGVLDLSEESPDTSAETPEAKRAQN